MRATVFPKWQENASIQLTYHQRHQISEVREANRYMPCPSTKTLRQSIALAILENEGGKSLRPQAANPAYLMELMEELRTRRVFAQPFLAPTQLP